MKIFSFFLLWLFFATKSFGADTTYYSALRKSLREADSGYIYVNYLKLASCSERIIHARPNEWLPYYYAAYAYIHMSFMEKDEDKKDLYCKNAQRFIDSALVKNPEMSEMNVLQALLYYALMEVNPYIRGILFFPKANSALDEACKYNPNNPRIYLLKGKSTIYTPEFLGGGKKAALPYLQKAMQLYYETRPENCLYPNWGMTAAEKLYEECNANNN